eukprot:TRINITY_DN2023_c0_g1_i7.p1 TRINITY_DN2023_c0_g1~~TRINITY_DN2023_c0_g1_i7.p1  ORF type:complete len:124 (+),score=14.83 TRINITY_DN2023_c0_g1_i7:48-419(+)
MSLIYEIPNNKVSDCSLADRERELGLDLVNDYNVLVLSKQIISIAKWLFTWIDHPVVDGYVLNQWLASRDASGVNLGHVCENNQVYNGYMPALQCSITEGDGFGFELSKTYEGRAGILFNVNL